MTCRDCEKVLTAYVDGELSLDSALRVEDHVVACLECRRRVDEERAIAKTVREEFPRVAPPEDLAWRAFSALPGPVQSRARTIGLGLAALMSVLWVGWRLGEMSQLPAPPRYVRDAVRVHEREVRDNSLGLLTSDPDVATDWLKNRLPFLPAGVLRKSERAQLLGVDVVEVGGRHVGYARYSGAEQQISLFLLPAGPLPASAHRFSVRGVEFRAFDWAGHRPIVWNHGSVSYILLASAQKSSLAACGVCHGSVAQFVPDVTDLGSAL